jgi:hypothetical protein
MVKKQKSIMKLKRQDIGLLAFGFVIGAVVTLALTMRPTSHPAGPLIAAALPPPRFMTINITNVQGHKVPGPVDQSSKVRENFNSPSPWPSDVRPAMHLIDGHYQPDLKVD